MIMNDFAVIEIAFTDYEGTEYTYVTGIGTDPNGFIIINTTGDPLKAMRFNTWQVKNDIHDKLMFQFIDLVRNYFPKKGYKISYKVVSINIK